MPLRIAIIGILFVLQGVWAVWDTIDALIEGRLWFNTGVLFVLTGIGLLRGLPRARWWARFWIILGYVGLAVVPILCFFHPGGAQVKLLGWERNGPPAIPYVFLMALLLIICLRIIHHLLYTDKASAYFARTKSSNLSV